MSSLLVDLVVIVKIYSQCILISLKHIGMVLYIEFI